MFFSETSLPARYPDGCAAPGDVGEAGVADDLPNTAEAAARFGPYALHSHFQPVYSLSAQRPVGYEALLRARTDDAEAAPVPPAALFGGLNAVSQSALDRLAHRMHLTNFEAQRDSNRWLFLNMTPDVFLLARHAPAGESFGDLLADLQIPPHGVVVEVLEKAVRDSAAFESAVDYFRELGCLIALDDFGAGSSNFDRVWKIRPEIVKLDRSLIEQATETKRVRRILPQIISLLHEAGAMVLVEGIETLDQAHIALDANADFAQGYLLGRPQPLLVEKLEARSVLGEVWRAFDGNLGRDWARQKNAFAPYIAAIGNAADRLVAGDSLEQACTAFFELEQSCICYLLDRNGQQIGRNLLSGFRPYTDPRLLPLNDTRNARWSRCPYFRRAIENFGEVQVTRPYLSIASAAMCVTVSISFLHQGQVRVICGDVNWQHVMGE